MAEDSTNVQELLKDLKSRVSKLEKAQNKVVDSVLNKILDAFEKDAVAYIPKLGQLEDELKQFKKDVNLDLEVLRETALGEPNEIAPPRVNSLSPEEKTAAQIETIKRNFQAFEQDTSEKLMKLEMELQEKYAALTHNINNHPMQARLDHIENRMQNFISKEVFRSLQDTMFDYATNETVDFLISKINKLDEKFVTKVLHEEGTEELRLTFEEKLATKISIEDFNEEMNQMDKDINEKLKPIQKVQETYRKTIKKLQKDFVEVVAVTNVQTELLKQKVDFSEIDKLWINFEKYSMYDDLKDLYMKTVPEISKFEMKINDFMRDMARQDEILRRFDEVLLDKVSKANMSDLVTKIESKYTELVDFKAFKTLISDKTKVNEVKIKEVQDTIDVLGQNITKDIFAAVKRATGHLQKAPPPGSQATTGELALATEELKSVVATKADKQMILDVSAQKANKIDTELTMRWVEVINRQLKQIIVLITEMLRFEVQKGDTKTHEGDQHIQYMRAFLLQQSLLISQWVNRFHTQTVNDYFIESSLGITELNWTPLDIQAFQKYAEEQLNEVDLEVLMTRNQILAKNMKMRSKSVIQGAFTLAKTQGGGGGSQTQNVSPRGPQKTLALDTSSYSPMTTFLNNKIHYGMNSTAYQTGGGGPHQTFYKNQANSSQANQSTIIESVFGEKDFSNYVSKNIRVNSGLRTLNHESNSRVLQGNRTLISMFPNGGGGGGRDNLRGEESIFKEDTSRRNLFNSTIQGDKNPQSTRRGGGATSNMGFGKSSSIMTAEGINLKDSIQSSIKKGTTLNASQMRKSLNLPGISSSK